MIDATLALARRELTSYFLTPTGYLVTALFIFFTALIFFGFAPLIGTGFTQGQPATLRLVMLVGVYVLFIITPALSMRTLSEEFRLGTWETLATAPVSDGQIILGKYLGSLAFLIIMLLPTLVFIIALEQHGRPDYGALMSGYLGLLLAGSAYLASGILISSLTTSQVLAYIITVFAWLIIFLATMGMIPLAALAGNLVPPGEQDSMLGTGVAVFEQIAHVIAVGNPAARVGDFVNGLVDTFNIVYFLALTVVFLALAVRAMGVRRLA